MYVMMLSQLPNNRMCTTFVDPNRLSALVTCQLIGLNKYQGVRLIGIGKTLMQSLPEQLCQYWRKILEILLDHCSLRWAQSRL